MKYFAWTFLTLALATACDPADESLGDTGGVGDSSGSSGAETTSAETEGMGSTSGPGGTETGSSQTNGVTEGCGDGGAASSFTLELGGQPIPPGTYTVELRRGADDSPITSCDVTLPEGDGSCIYIMEEDYTAVSLSPDDENDLQAPMRLLITHSGVVIHDETREFDHEPNNDPCWSSTRGTGQVDLAVLQCSALETAFEEAHEEVRSCTEASECGTVISGFSCGCTRDWVGRLDADENLLTDAAQAGVDGECGWAMWGGTCDCPEADGFDCIDNICTWNYTQK